MRKAKTQQRKRMLDRRWRIDRMLKKVFSRITERMTQYWFNLLYRNALAQALHEHYESLRDEVMSLKKEAE